jgi:hydrogenase nickel incorporation protein HypB
MCDSCGCGQPHHGHEHEHEHGHSHAAKTISVEEDIHAKNDAIAATTRRMLAERGVVAVNLISSPGSGKTTLLERALTELAGEIPFAVVEGDQQTDRDAARIAACGVPVVQVNTISACHLNAEQVAGALAELPLDDVRVVFLENVGNLVCPASFDLGENFKAVVLSVAEGDDKPLKYPLAFNLSRVMLLTKTDLLSMVDFDPDAAEANARKVSPDIEIIRVSCRGEGDLSGWLEFVRGLVSTSPQRF